MEKLEVTIASSSRCRPHKERGSHHLIDIGCDMALQVRVAPRKKRLVTNNHVKKPRLWSSRLSSLQVVLQNLLKCVILFYTVYYVVLSLGCRALSAFSLNGGHLLHLWIAFHSGCGRMGLGLCYFSNCSPCCHHFN
ncbi:PREDICTED: transmembrane protein 244 isoform X2 [Myotis brandtii]|uniref:transmembrane protein 244 isoform X1 n=1 Tax=Myotis brandtii TaxID=109478 RepID=UPI00070473D1|nr:PREDICTED: transmembrane protein 244 isoform X1 [Myotis brandtii]XP_014389281.1 PREDICTED: transmembrane protein 244 isoform X2 [Myotis brandtii]